MKACPFPMGMFLCYQLAGLDLFQVQRIQLESGLLGKVIGHRRTLVRHRFVGSSPFGFGVGAWRWVPVSAQMPQVCSGFFDVNLSKVRHVTVVASNPDKSFPSPIRNEVKRDRDEASSSVSWLFRHCCFPQLGKLCELTSHSQPFLSRIGRYLSSSLWIVIILRSLPSAVLARCWLTMRTNALPCSFARSLAVCVPM